MNDFEMRWFQPQWFSYMGGWVPHKILQYRFKQQTGPANALGAAWAWSEWQAVPTFVEGGAL